MEVFPTKRPRELVSLLVSAHSLLEKTIGDMVSSSSVNDVAVYMCSRLLRMSDPACLTRDTPLG